MSTIDQLVELVGVGKTVEGNERVDVLDLWRRAFSESDSDNSVSKFEQAAGVIAEKSALFKKDFEGTVQEDQEVRTV